MKPSNRTMLGIVLPGDSTVVFRDIPIPAPGHGQVLVRTKANSICGSNTRAIYRVHLGKGAEGYRVAAEGASGKVAIVLGGGHGTDPALAARPTPA